jgi:hypothetical protein
MKLPPCLCASMREGRADRQHNPTSEQVHRVLVPGLPSLGLGLIGSELSGLHFFQNVVIAQ